MTKSIKLKIGDLLVAIKFNDKVISKFEKQDNEYKSSADSISINQTTINFLRYKRLTDDDDGFVVLQGDSYAEFLQVEGLGLDALSPVQVANILNSDHQFFKVLLRMI